MNPARHNRSPAALAVGVCLAVLLAPRAILGRGFLLKPHVFRSGDTGCTPWGPPSPAGRHSLRHVARRQGSTGPEAAEGEAVRELLPADAQAQLERELSAVASPFDVLDLVGRYLRYFKLEHSTACLKKLFNKRRALEFETEQEQADARAALADLAAIHADLVQDAKFNIDELETTVRYAGGLAHLDPSMKDLRSTVYQVVADKTNLRMRPIKVHSLFRRQSFQNREFLETMVPVLSENLYSYSPGMLKELTMHCRKVKVDSPKLLSVIVENVVLRLESFNPTELSWVMSNLAALGERSTELREVVAAFAASTMDYYGTQDLVRLSLAITNMGLQDEEFMLAVARAATWQMEEFEAWQVADLVWMAARHKMKDPDFFSAAAEAIIRDINRLDNRTFDKVVYGYGAMNVTNMELMEAVKAKVLNTPWDKLPNRAMATTLWSYGMMQIKDQEMLDAMASQAPLRWRRENWESMDPQDVTRVVWSFGALGELNLTMMEAAEEYTLENIQVFEPLHLCCELTGFARLQYKRPKFLDAVATHAIQRIQEYRPGDLSFLAANFALLNTSNPEMMEAISKQATDSMEQFAPVELGRLAWGFVELKVPDKALIEKIVATTIEKAKEFRPRDWNTVLDAVVRTGGIETGPLLRACAQNMEKGSLKEYPDTFIQHFAALSPEMADLPQELLSDLEAEVRERNLAEADR